MPEAELSGPSPASSSDPWENLRAFHNLEYCSPFDVLAFTERQLLAIYWDYFFGAHCDKKHVPHTFWKRVQSCELLKALCAPYSSRHFNIMSGYPPGHTDAVERLHAVMELLQRFHWREAGFGDQIRRKQDGEPTRREQQRYWEGMLRGLKRATSLVEKVPDLLLTEPQREQISGIMRPATEKAAQFAKNPPTSGLRIVFAQFAPDGTETPLVFDVPPNLTPDPPKKGQSRNTGSAAFTFNLEVALLDEFLPPGKTGGPRWKRLLDLLRHFNPENFASVSLDALRKRVQWFRGEHPEILQDHKQRYLARARHLMGTRPV